MKKYFDKPTFFHIQDVEGHKIAGNQSKLKACVMLVLFANITRKILPLPLPLPLLIMRPEGGKL